MMPSVVKCIGKVSRIWLFSLFKLPFPSAMNVAHHAGMLPYAFYTMMRADAHHGCEHLEHLLIAPHPLVKPSCFGPESKNVPVFSGQLLFNCCEKAVTLHLYRCARNRSPGLAILRPKVFQSFFPWQTFSPLVPVPYHDSCVEVPIAFYTYLCLTVSTLGCG